MKHLRVALASLAITLVAFAQTTISIPLNYSDTASIKAAGWTFIGLMPGCRHVTNRANPCDSEEDIDYWRMNKCQILNGPGCISGRDADQPCDTAVPHPGEWWIPGTTGSLLATANSENTLYHSLPANWTSVEIVVASFLPPIPAVRGTVPQAGGGVYADDNDLLLFTVGADVNGGFITAINKSKGSVGPFVPTYGVFNKDATGSYLPFKGILRIDRNDTHYTYLYSVDGVNWITYGTTTSLTSYGRAFIYTGQAGTSHAPCYHSGGIKYSF